MKRDILSMTFPELAEDLKARGEKPFRTGQIMAWLHKRGASSFDEMTDLGLSLRESLDRDYTIPRLTTLACRVSPVDGTRKYAFGLGDGTVIESVFLRYHYGNTVCISSQAGCRMGCRFCASALDGLTRNLTPSEMLRQIYQIRSDVGEKISHVVVMGTGEPLDNLDNLIRFLRILTEEGEGGFSQRNVTVSTCGLVPGIDRLAQENFSLTLALSLHAPNDALRRTMMPIARVYSIGECLSACDRYFRKTGRRISYEYSLVRGVNDGAEEARELAALLRGRSCHVNLIPVNPIREREYRRPQPERVRRFRDILQREGVSVTIRRELGADIDGACGQLRKKVENQKG